MSAAEELQIRPANIEDVEALWAIESAVFSEDAWSLGAFRAELTEDHRHYVVLETGGGTPVGYAGLLAVGSSGDIQTIAVSPEYRGRGFGRQLMNELLREAVQRGVREVFLEVRADNPVAEQLYETLGFERIAIRPHYYQPGGVDAVVMRAELKGAA